MKEVFFGFDEIGSYLRVNPHLRKDVCITDFYKFFGPIKNGILSEERKSFFYKNFTPDIFPRNNHFQSIKRKRIEANKFWKWIADCYESELQLLNEKEIRVWYSGRAGEMAGLYYLCSLLEGKKIKINVIYKADTGLDCTDSYSHEEMKDAVRVTKPLSDAQIHTYAERWKELLKENQCFRTVKNGELVSDFVDFRDGLTTLLCSATGTIILFRTGLRTSRKCSPRTTGILQDDG